MKSWRSEGGESIGNYDKGELAYVNENMNGLERRNEELEFLMIAMGGQWVVFDMGRNRFDEDWIFTGVRSERSFLWISKRGTRIFTRNTFFALINERIDWFVTERGHATRCGTWTTTTNGSRSSCTRGYGWSWTSTLQGSSSPKRAGQVRKFIISVSAYRTTWWNFRQILIVALITIPFGAILRFW